MSVRLARLAVVAKTARQEMRVGSAASETSVVAFVVRKYTTARVTIVLGPTCFRFNVMLEFPSTTTCRKYFTYYITLLLQESNERYVAALDPGMRFHLWCSESEVRPLVCSEQEQTMSCLHYILGFPGTVCSCCVNTPPQISLPSQYLL